MKRMMLLILSLAMLLALAACGSAPAPVEEPAAPAQEAAETPAEEPAQAPETAAEAPETPEEEPETTDVAGIIAQVQAMQGQPVQDLIDWLGEPEAKDYSSSCLVDGGQDGQWTYEGFTVYTLVQPDGTETVYDCE